MEDLKLGDKVICIKSTVWYKVGQVGEVVEVRDPKKTNISEGYSPYIVAFEGEAASYYMKEGTIALLEEQANDC